MVWTIKHVTSPIDRFVVNASGGRLRPPTSIAVPTLLLTTTGRRTGEERTIPLVFVCAGDLYVVGNARPAGERRNPWVLNLRAASEGVVREGGRSVPVVARELDGAERERWWGELVEVWPALADHYADTGERAVFVLEPTDAEAPPGDPAGRERRRRPPRLVRRKAARVLSDAIGHGATRDVITRADAAYPGIAGRLPSTRAGARNLLETSSYAIALRDPIVNHGLDVDQANSLVADVVTESIMPARALLFRLTRLRHRDRVERARWGAKLSRHLYYTDPDWVMEDVQVDDGFGFDVTRCVVAEFFASCDMSDLCQRAICDQDLRSATRHGVVLRRSETLAAGGTRCDFRYPARNRNLPPSSEDV